MPPHDASTLLRDHGFRATPARIAVLQFLKKQKHGVGADDIGRAVPKTDPVTIYRMLEAFAEKGIVHAIDVGHGHTDYELADGEHHHHIICECCGRVEAVAKCDAHDIERAAKRASALFASVRVHRLSFYGTCTRCAARET